MEKIPSENLAHKCITFLDSFASNNNYNRTNKKNNFINVRVRNIIIHYKLYPSTDVQL